MKKILVILVLLLLVFQLFADKPRLAVMNFVDDSDDELSENVIKIAAKRIRSSITRKAKKYFEMVTDEENEVALAEMKKKSYGIDRDKSYQIQLGKKVSASKIIIPTISYADEEKFLISLTLIDIKRGVDENSADEYFDGTIDSLEEAVDTIISQLLETAEAELEEAAYSEAMDEDSISGWDQYLLTYKGVNKRHSKNAENKLEELKEREERRESRAEAKAQRKMDWEETKEMKKMKWEETKERQRMKWEEENRRKEKEEKLIQQKRKEIAETKDRWRSGRSMKKGGGALIGIGIGVTVTGLALFYAGKNSNDSNDYDDSKKNSNNTLTKTGLSFLIIGPVLTVGGLILTPIGAVKQNRAKVKLESLGVFPTKDGMFASVGLRF